MKQSTFYYLLRRGVIGGGGSSGGGSFTGLLDTYSGAAAAYSLRQLSSTYSGDAIVVRRASDNTTQSIGFVNNELDTATLESFCSGTDGFVTTWYDQSGNANNATQATASRQPKIVSAGSAILENGRAVVQYDGVDDALELNSEIVTTDAFRHFIACDNDTDGRVYDSNSQTDSILIQSFRYILRVNFTSVFVNSSTGRDKNIIEVGRDSSDSIDFVVNNSTLSSGTVISGQSKLSQIGSLMSPYGGTIYEVITYNSDATISSLDISGLRGNINTHYSIY